MGSFNVDIDLAFDDEPLDGFSMSGTGSFSTPTSFTLNVSTPSNDDGNPESLSIFNVVISGTVVTFDYSGSEGARLTVPSWDPVH